MSVKKEARWVDFSHPLCCCLCSVCFVCCSTSYKSKRESTKIVVELPAKEVDHKDPMDNDSVDENEDENSFASRIAPTLEKSLAHWQEAINNYRAYEEYCFEEKYKDVAVNIHIIRNNPDVILITPGCSSQMMELARLRKLVYRAKEKVGAFDDQSADTAMFNDISSNQLENNRIVSPMHSSRPVSRAVSDADYLNLEDKFSSRFSKTWAQRLGGIIPTQGEMSVTKSGMKMRLRPKWPDYLSNVTYQIIKRNRIGQRMHRILRLTEYHILNIKNGDMLSKVYSFSQIKRVILEDSETLLITLKTGKLLVFISNLAPNIAQQIITRVKVRLQLDRVDFSSSSPTLGYTEALTATIIQNISVDAQDNSDAMKAFAEELRDRTIRSYIDSYNGRRRSRKLIQSENGFLEEVALNVTPQTDLPFETEQSDEELALKAVATVVAELVDAVISKDSEKISEASKGSEAQAPQNEITPPSTPITTPAKRLSTSKRTLTPINIFAFAEGSREYEVKTEIQRIIFDPSTPEGNTKRIFIEKFYTLSLEAESPMQCLQQVRLFIDGMHGHLLKKKGIELAKLIAPKETYDVVKKMFVNVINHPLEDISNPILAKRASIAEQQNIKELVKLDQNVLALLSFLIFIVVEEATFIPLRQEILSLLQTCTNSEAEENLQLRRKVFSNRTQSQWGIPDNVISSLGWKSAIFELSSLENNLTPSMMLNALSRTAKAIYSEYKLAVVPQLPEKDRANAYLSADDLVPVFIYIFCQSDLSHSILNKELMWSLCHPDQLHGEYGYYLTAYESALEYVIHETLTAEEALAIDSLKGTRGTDSSLSGEYASPKSDSFSPLDVRQDANRISRKNRSSVFLGYKVKRDLLRQSFG